MRSILITGGAGFVGTNAATYFHRKGWRVVVLDNLSRRGSKDNLEWLRSGMQLQFIQADVRERDAMDRVVKETKPDAVLHLAAQVAVTTSITDPRDDFDNNALGTLNVLDAVRRLNPEAIFIVASTNKVYGKMADVEVVERNGRYEYRDIAGVNETQPLDFYSPYGCSKGVADQYALDYSRIYGLRTMAFRQSCIYGPRQFGIEDQGWVAWFVIAALLRQKITIFGDGKQIRDVLHVEDLCRAYEAAIERADAVTGQAFNIGGGPQNTLSLLELVSFLEEDLSVKIPLHWGDWRPGDQRVFVCDLEKAARQLEWTPEISVREGVHQLAVWVQQNRQLFS